MTKDEEIAHYRDQLIDVRFDLTTAQARSTLLEHELEKMTKRFETLHDKYWNLMDRHLSMLEKEAERA